MTKRGDDASPRVGEAPPKAAEGGREGEGAAAPLAQTHNAPHPPTPAPPRDRFAVPRFSDSPAAKRPEGGGGVAYRDAVDADAAALAAFARASWLATFGHLSYPPDDLARYLAKNYGAEIQRAEIADPEVRYRLALRDGAIVGYCMMGVLSMPVDDAGGLELHRLYVDESVKGAGVAAALMDDAIAWARGRRASAFYLSVWEHNERAQRFYRRYGFADFGEWDFMVGETADRDLIWRLAL